MKILKKPKILPCKCENCKCEFLPKRKNLEYSYLHQCYNEVRCPFCGSRNYVQFEEGERDGKM